MNLLSEIQYIKGVGPSRAKLLRSLGINTVMDLLHFFPRRYLDLTPLNFEQGRDDSVGAFPCLVADYGYEVLTRSKTRIVKIPVTDGRRKGSAVFFNQPYMKDAFRPGDKLVLIGKIRKNYGEYEILNPEWQKFEETDYVDYTRICPVYPLTKGLTQKIMRKIIKSVLQETLEVDEVLPKSVLKEYRLMPKASALRNIHFPESWEELKKAQERFAFEELLLFQLAMMITRRHLMGEVRKNTYKDFDLKPFLKNLPFYLTEGQKRVVKEIISDLKSDRIMNRLIQGDVGSGKTVVASIALYLAVKNGYQGAFMVPTEILSIQHGATLKKFLNPHGIKVEILKGDMPKAVKEQILGDLEKGRIDVVVGTHALIQDNVKFSRLGMVVTDEQHRFGVRQREALVKKGYYPDVLVMSATPIPRTLALTIYSDLDISVIDTMPEGRQKVETYVVDESMRTRVYKFMESEIRKGNQAYVVCPAVEESDIGLSSVEEIGRELQDAFPHLRIGILHGKMKTEEKDRIMKDFCDKKIDVLVATTVVEVGVDVPSATLMVVENAERFGLAQLHQLRGRVGRSNLKSYCVLISGSKEMGVKARLNFMMRTHNGFEIAQKDLELRGPGEFLGVKQHGMPEFKFAGLVKDLKLLETTKALAGEIIKKDLLSTTEYRGIKRDIEEKFKIV
ncbi:ATP-dependent DNA helicase RecG [Thermosediminibacter litoriperuensis]|uniref:ATP-dependent DNA helicase RecG n=1 Tax=Thermosediminibacter litoriperuensis TaxID=291989 RepID=A0A5S5B0A4_9FIRM|nr:ATP-dependent DNA helicase RecG [Thermosediminibacter litoriperuensis]TYP59988.1 ATP-dependent DNA helicase RecG [Thermosediminibacter litoriperuensis]